MCVHLASPCASQFISIQDFMYRHEVTKRERYIVYEQSTFSVSVTHMLTYLYKCCYITQPSIVKHMASDTSMGSIDSYIP